MVQERAGREEVRLCWRRAEWKRYAGNLHGFVRDISLRYAFAARRSALKWTAVFGLVAFSFASGGGHEAFPVFEGSDANAVPERADEMRVVEKSDFGGDVADSTVGCFQQCLCRVDPYLRDVVRRRKMRQVSEELAELRYRIMGDFRKLLDRYVLVVMFIQIHNRAPYRIVPVCRLHFLLSSPIDCRSSHPCAVKAGDWPHGYAVQTVGTVGYEAIDALHNGYAAFHYLAVTPCVHSGLIGWIKLFRRVAEHVFHFLPSRDFHIVAVGEYDLSFGILHRKSHIRQSFSHVEQEFHCRTGLGEKLCPHLLEEGFRDGFSCVSFSKFHKRIIHFSHRFVL